MRGFAGCFLGVLLATVFTARAAEAEDANPTTAPAIGRSEASWPLPPDGAFEKSYFELIARHQFKIVKGYPEKIRDGVWPGGASPTYQLYVPKDYDGSKPFGLIVWISPTNSGKPPREDYLKVFDDHHLIYVGPDKVGNEVDALWRHWMAIESVRNAREHFPNIDANRIYVAGVSGGGRIASHVAVVNPDTFTGGFYIVGCDFYRDTPVPPDSPNAGKYYPGFWRKSSPKLIAQSKLNRFVLLTGEHDQNNANTRSVYTGYKQAGYKHVEFFDVPGMGHHPPEGEWFEKGIAFLDSVKAPATKPAKPAGKHIVIPRK
jgi:poly(3-hydroxybutyrate) depolymerase